MSDILQWVIVGAAVIAAAVFLVRRMRKRASGTCGSCCDACPMGADFAEECSDNLALNRESAPFDKAQAERKGRKPEP